MKLHAPAPSLLANTLWNTQRLILRQWREADFAPFADLNANFKVMEYFPKPLTRSESDALAHAFQGFITKHGFGFWAVALKDTGIFIGFVGLSIPTITLPFSPCIEVGWRLDAKYWGKGYATEAAQEAVRIGFEVLDLHEIVSFTTLTNQRSRRVMTKLGMQEEDLTFEHPKVPVGHPLREHCLYRLRRA